MPDGSTERKGSAEQRNAVGQTCNRRKTSEASKAKKQFQF